MHKSCGIDQNIDGSDLFSEAIDGFIRKNVELTALGAWNTLEFFRIAIGSTNNRAFTNEGFSNGSPNSLASSSYNRNFTF